MSEINVYLKNNEAKECCFFTYNYLEHKIDENLISKGCYKFSVGKNNNPNLSYAVPDVCALAQRHIAQHRRIRGHEDCALIPGRFSTKGQDHC